MTNPVAFLTTVLDSAATGWVLTVLGWFVALYPLAVSMLALDSSRHFDIDRHGIATARIEPSAGDLATAMRRWPRIGIVVPARNEAADIAACLGALARMRWPHVSILVIDDGSTDATAARVAEIAALDPRIRLVSFPVAGGKARGLNFALGELDTELVLGVDADSIVEVDLLERMVPHFAHSDDIAAVTANPRVADTSNLLGILQAVEFAGTVSALRRGQAAWGRIATMSGICTVMRRDAVRAVGGFDATMHAEDIELSWRLQVNGWRVTYEPEALVGMGVPTTLHGWWRQRRRWAIGLVEALTCHARALCRTANRAQWPLALDALMSLLWCHALFFCSGLWALQAVASGGTRGALGIPARWGALTLVVASGQIFWGMRLDRRHDTGIARLWWAVPLYPLLYWWLSATVVVVTTLPTVLGRRRPVAWTPDRSAQRSAQPASPRRHLHDPPPVAHVPAWRRDRGPAARRERGGGKGGGGAPTRATSTSVGRGQGVRIGNAGCGGGPDGI